MKHPTRPPDCQSRYLESRPEKIPGAWRTLPARVRQALRCQPLVPAPGLASATTQAGRKRSQSPALRWPAPAPFPAPGQEFPAPGQKFPARAGSPSERQQTQREGPKTRTGLPGAWLQRWLGKRQQTTVYPGWQRCRQSRRQKLRWPARKVGGTRRSTFAARPTMC